MLPKEELYMPPMNIRVRDHRQFGRKPNVGVYVLRTMEDFRCEPLLPAADEEEEGREGQGYSNMLIFKYVKILQLNHFLLFMVTVWEDDSILTCCNFALCHDDDGDNDDED